MNDESLNVSDVQEYTHSPTPNLQPCREDLLPPWNSIMQTKSSRFSHDIQNAVLNSVLQHKYVAENKLSSLRSNTWWHDNQYYKHLKKTNSSNYSQEIHGTLNKEYLPNAGNIRSCYVC